MQAGLDALLHHLGSSPAHAVRGVFDDWEGIVGARIAAHTTPRSLKDGVLSVDVDDPAWASQLGFMEAELIARMDGRLGPGSVVAIRHRVRPGPDASRGA